MMNLPGEESGSCYVVAWTGGLEAPAFVATKNIMEAKSVAASWKNDSKDEDSIVVLKVDSSSCKIELA